MHANHYYWLYLASVNHVILMNISLQTYLRCVGCTYLVSIAICEIMLFSVLTAVYETGAIFSI